MYDQKQSRITRNYMPPNPFIEYPLSLPERSLRAGAALLGGLTYEATQVLLPRSLRDTRLYQTTVARLLRIVVELIGGVDSVAPAGTIPVEELAWRKATGNAIELASFLAFGLSPVWVLAAIADLSGGTRTYLQALAAELRRTGLLAPDTQVGSVEELLQALEQTSGAASDAVDLPPLNVAELRRSWHAFQQGVQGAELPDANELDGVFRDLQRVAAEENSSLLGVSGLVAAGALRAGFELGNTHIVGYYREALGTIAQEGVVRYLWRVAQPYLTQVGRHFDPRRPTYTERWLRRP
jgi:hypothetical protein